LPQTPPTFEKVGQNFNAKLRFAEEILILQGKTLVFPMKFFVQLFFKKVGGCG
jgi:hypothetical protein